MDKGKGRYDDIIDLPHHQSATRPHMSVSNRAAQFAPFAALTGFEAKVDQMADTTTKEYLKTNYVKDEDLFKNDEGNQDYGY